MSKQMNNQDITDRERVILVSIEPDELMLPYAWEELTALTETAGADVVGELHQNRDEPDPKTYIGSGKAKELHMSVLDTNADLIIVDGELTSVQARNLEEEVKCRVIDRTQLILDIFAQRAQTREGKVQVTLAQQMYLLPRLGNLYTKFERQQGGIGVRGGAGETKLEADRRKVRDGIKDLEAQLAEIRATLHNTLSGSGVYADPKLFATLDPTTRRVTLPDGWAILLTDTVGFVRNLPTHLVAAFRATLEETIESDFLIHVVDVSHPYMETQMRAVLDVLDDLGAGNKPIVTVFNKCDLVDDQQRLTELILNTPNSVYISATKGDGIPNMVERIVKTMEALLKPINVVVPYDKSELVAQCYEYGRVSAAEYLEDGIHVVARITGELVGRIARYEIEPDAATEVAAV